MPTTKKRINFFESLEGVEIENILRQMMIDTAYNTEASYSADGLTFPDHQMPFLEKHKRYIMAHPGIDPKLYVSNLRLITRHR